MGRKKKFTKAKRAVREDVEVRSVVIRRPYVYVKVAYGNEGDSMLGHGFTKCLPTDEWDEVRGVNIAKGRAEVDIARQLCAQNP